MPLPEKVAVSDTRRKALRDFAARALGDPAIAIESASADASFRSYWRVRRMSAGAAHGAVAACDAPAGAVARPADDAKTYIVMDAPPGREDIAPWLDVAQRLRDAGLHAPGVFAEDRTRGFVLMEDLGARTYLPVLDDTTVDALYGDALDALVRMQTAVDVAGLPAYDRERLVAEMELMPEWLLKHHFGFRPSCEEWDVIEAAFTHLVQAAQEQPRAFVHRDYHSRNLLVCREPGSATRVPEEREDRGFPASPGILDFQDAVVGPVTYDLVSLLRDCYIEWDEARVHAWTEIHRQRLREARRIGARIDARRFRRWFDLMGVQRHVKVLGIFCRLWYRDGKAQYLADLPRVWRYTLEVARAYPELVGFADLLQRARGDRDLAQPRAAGPTP